MRAIDAMCAALALPASVRAEVDRVLGRDAIDVARSEPERVALAVEAFVAFRRLERHLFEVKASAELARHARDAIKRRGVQREGNPFSYSVDVKGEAALRRLLALGVTEQDLS